jgi:hypothetical protein
MERRKGVPLETARQQMANPGGSDARSTARGRRTAPAPAQALSRPTQDRRVCVRMFRVGFGDFFLLTVPAAGGSKHYSD